MNPIPIPGVAYPVRHTNLPIAGVAYPDDSTRLGIPGVAYPGGGPSFSAPLKSTLVPENFMGYGLPTFTRASTATVMDFEGLYRTAKSGEARFEGARRVENLETNSAFAGPSGVPTGWIQVIGTGTSVSIAKKDGFAIKQTAVAQRPFIEKTISTVAGNKYRVSFTIDAITSLPSTPICGFYTGGLFEVPITLTGSSVPGRYATDVITINNTSTAIRIGIGAAPSTTDTGDITFSEVMLEEVTGQANTNPSEYISSGVLSSPYHGAGVDGVKYFTYQNGNTVSSNVVAQASGAAISDATLQGYMTEGSVTNLILQSETLGTTWTKTGLVVTSNTITSPAGQTTGDTLTATSGNATLLQAVTSASADRTFSIWMRRKTGSGNIDLTVDNGATWTTKTITSSWARYEITQSAVTNPTCGIRIVTIFDEIYAWGAQIENGNFASSYIPTTTAAVTRNSDSLLYPTTGNIGDKQGTLYAEIINKSTSGLTNARIADFGGGNAIPLYIQTTTNYLSFNDASPRISSLVFTPSATITKMGSKWGGSSTYIALSGVLSSNLGFDGSFGTPPVTSIQIGCSLVTNRELFGNIRNVKIWKYQLSNDIFTAMTA